MPRGSSALAESPLPPVPPRPLLRASATERHGAAMGGVPASQSEEGVSVNSHNPLLCD